MSKLPNSWFHPIFPVLMAAIMSGVMTFVITAVNIGFPSDFVVRWLKSYGIGFCVAIPAIYVIAPFARRMASALVEHSK